MSKQVLPLVSTEATCCAPISDGALAEEQAVDLARTFKALGDPVRLRLLSMITSAAGGEVCVCDLTVGFDVSGPTISHHLRVLREAGLVDCERRGTWVYYWPRPDKLKALAALLDTGAGRSLNVRAPSDEQSLTLVDGATHLRSDQSVLISVESDVIKVLADPLRARIVAILAEGPACNCHLIADTGATQSNVSNHLRALRQAGMIAAEPSGRYTYYRLVPEILDAAAQGLTHLAARARSTTEIRREC